MSEKVKVPLWQNPRNFAYVENGATVGATVGVNLFWQSGALVKESDLSGATQPEVGGVSQTLWSLVLQIPAPVIALAGVSGTGFFAITGVGTGALRSFVDSDTIGWTDPDGVSGDPAADFIGNAADIPFDGAAHGMSATNVEDGIVEASTGDGEIVAGFDGGGAVVSVGAFVDVPVPWDCTIDSASVFGDPSGSIVISVWVCAPANYPPDSGDNIAASSPPTLSSGVYSIDNTLTGWTATLNKGDVVRFTVQSCIAVEHATVNLEVTKT